MKIYLDCDGVLLNTEKGLFDEYDILKMSNPELKRIVYLQNMDWEYWLEQAGDINDAINIMKNYDPNAADILTKVHSMNEAVAKINYFRDKGVRNNIIIVPYYFKKSQIVDPYGNVLVDDSNSNLIDWNEHLGIPFSFGSGPSEFDKIESIDEVLNPKKFELKLAKFYRK